MAADPHRKYWNEQQKKLRAALNRPAGHPEAVDLFLSQHAPLHARSVSGMEGWSFEEAVWDGLSEAAARRVFGADDPSTAQSIAWIFWHLARIEDMTMNLLFAGTEQVFNPDWQMKLRLTVSDTGNRLPVEDIASLSAQVDLLALRAYRNAVGVRTREIIQTLNLSLLRRKTDPDRIETLRRTGQVLPEAYGLLDYWGGSTLAGLLLMPPTRHCFLHLNEAARMKARGMG